VPLNSTCKKVLGLAFSKITSFLVNQIAQINAAAATSNKVFVLGPFGLNHGLNNLSLLAGILMPKDT